MFENIYEQNIYLNIFLIFFYLINFIKSSNIFLDYKYVNSLTLLDGKILLLTESNAILYDYELNNTLNKFDFDDTITSNEENYGTTLDQFPSNYGSYIILLRNGKFYIFEKNLDKKCWAISQDTNITSLLYHYSLTPYYKDGDNLHFILAYKSDTKQIKIIHFNFNINTCYIKVINPIKEFYPKKIIVLFMIYMDLLVK